MKVRFILQYKAEEWRQWHDVSTAYTNPLMSDLWWGMPEGYTSEENARTALAENNDICNRHGTPVIWRIVRREYEDTPL